MQDDAVLSLEMAERSDGDLVGAALDRAVAGDDGMAAVQACVLLDGSLRLRYAKVSAAWLDPPLHSPIAVWHPH